MKTCFSILICLGLASIALGAPKKLPSYLQFCKRSDPNFDSCTVKLIENIRPQLAKGISQMQVPPLEPFVLPVLQVERDNEALQVTAILKNLKVKGASAFQINKLRTDIKNNLIELSVTLPHLDVTTDYDVKGRLLLVPLNGKGVFVSNITNTRADLKITGKAIEKRGTKYLEVTDVVTKVKVGDSKMDFLGGGKGNDLISSSSTQFIQQNRDQVMEIVNPLVEDTASAVVQQIANRILGSVPYDTILPP
ncbi:hypothetical protein J437_LFUL002474 [Ladona fulva]|uniref:Circadian clock-controlled protein n=1 Tax=Ladona fulva TaxID=123851 RepID=A0A8K0NRE9_LADFU|nr:hypothetical protein J437_LFUL002474 [Ladona fulva]